MNWRKESGPRAVETLISTLYAYCNKTEDDDQHRRGGRGGRQQHRRPFQECIKERRLMTEGQYYCIYVDDILILTVPGKAADEMQALL